MTIIKALFAAVMIYLMLTIFTWQINNPVGNAMTYWTYMPLPLLLVVKHPDLQPKPEKGPIP